MRLVHCGRVQAEARGHPGSDPGHEVAAYLESDADLLREYLGEQRGGLKVVKA
ncbi:MAG: hypothetical protein IIB90_13640 [Gemmatimonadetes bacterium]|nr:hypothetical protein [Gemmatimonadota bacterium]